MKNEVTVESRNVVDKEKSWSCQDGTSCSEKSKCESSIVVDGKANYEVRIVEFEAVECLFALKWGWFL